MSDCLFCHADGGTVLWRDDALRVIDADVDAYPGFTRVIWQSHVREMTDLTVAERLRLMNVVWAVERAQRETLAPDKINLASLGNMTPHLHWHVIPRWHDDRHFPDTVWTGDPLHNNARAAQARARQVTAQLADYHTTLVCALQTLPT